MLRYAIAVVFLSAWAAERVSAQVPSRNADLSAVVKNADAKAAADADTVAKDARVAAEE